MQQAIVAPGRTKLYRTYFNSDNGTHRDMKDDIYLGTDFIIDSGDPDIITTNIDLSFIPEDYPYIASLKNIFSNHSYYKLRELIANRNNIVHKLRRENKLIDITPKEPKIETVKARLVKN